MPTMRSRVDWGLGLVMLSGCDSREYRCLDGHEYMRYKDSLYWTQFGESAGEPDIF